MAEPLPPLDDTTDRTTDRTTTPTAYDSSRSSGGVSASRHLTSVLLALLLVPAAYALADYSSKGALVDIATLGQGRLPTEVIVTMAASAACFLAAAAAGRISALGPLVAGLVWGAGPTVWLMLDYSSYNERLLDIPNFYDGLGLGLLTAGFALFPAVTGLLLGAAFAGRWRGSR